MHAQLALAAVPIRLPVYNTHIPPSSIHLSSSLSRCPPSSKCVETTIRIHHQFLLTRYYTLCSVLMTLDHVPVLTQLEIKSRQNNPLTKARYPSHLAGTPEDVKRRSEKRFASSLHDPSSLNLVAIDPVTSEPLGFAMWSPPSTSSLFPSPPSAPPVRYTQEERADLRADCDMDVMKVMSVEHDRLEKQAFPNDERHWSVYRCSVILSFSPVIYMLTTATDDSGRRYLSNIVVSSDHQGKGIGSGLLAVGTDAADKEGLPIFCLSSDEVSRIKKKSECLRHAV